MVRFSVFFSVRPDNFGFISIDEFDINAVSLVGSWLHLNLALREGLLKNLLQFASWTSESSAVTILNSNLFAGH
jgi:hypothetical protein